MMQARFAQETMRLAGKIREAHNFRSARKYDEALSILRDILDNYHDEDGEDSELRKSISDEVAAIVAEEAQVSTGEGDERTSDLSFGELPSIKLLKAYLVYENNAAVDFIQFGQYEQSYKLLSDIVPAFVALSGLNHMDNLDSRFNLALALEGLKRFSESLEQYSSVFTIAKDLLGPRDSFTLTTQFRIAFVMQQMGMVEIALEKFEQVVTARSELMTPNHPELLNTHLYHAVCLLDNHRLSQAHDLLTSVLDKYNEIFGPDNRRTLVVQSFIGRVLVEKGEHLEAIRVYNYALDRLRRTVGVGHSDTKMTESFIRMLEQRVGPSEFAELEKNS